jgi:2-polyprenyl-3-methyl-5-hydroxy-6-metoxy-1,4-benzoquinol methylase
MSPSTDNSLAIASAEFLWSEPEAPEAHAYLIPPTLSALRDFGAHTLLDLGCGNGAGTARLSIEGFHATGCDSSESGLTLARRTYPRLNFFWHDISSPLPARHLGAYDAVVALEVVEHLMQPRQLARRAWEALRPGGAFIVSTPYHGYWKNLALAVTNRFDAHWHPLRDFGHVKFFSQSTLRSLLDESGFLLRQNLRLGRVPALARSMMAVAVKAQS